MANGAVRNPGRMKVGDVVRHGDLMLEMVKAIPDGDTGPLSHRILAHGEATGHAHRLNAEDCDLVERNGDLWFTVRSKDGKVTHEEHDTIKLPPGHYRVNRQQEYVAKEVVRQVLD